MAQYVLHVAVDRAPLGAAAVKHQPRSPAQRRSGSVTGCGSRSGRLGAGAASKALQVSLPSVPEADSIRFAGAAIVTRADCWLAKTYTSGTASKACVTRDDLSQPVHSGARRAEEGAS
jgi:hypothetical protein